MDIQKSCSGSFMQIKTFLLAILSRIYLELIIYSLDTSKRNNEMTNISPGIRILGPGKLL